MSRGVVRLTIERKCLACGEFEEVRTTKFTEEHRERVIDPDEQEFSASFHHEEGCTYDGPPAVTVRVHNVDDGLPSALRRIRRDYETDRESAVSPTPKGDDVQIDDRVAYEKADGAIEAIDRIIDEVDARGP